MDLLTPADLSALAVPVPKQVHVSLFMPTHRVGRSAIEADQLRWKNLVGGVEAALSRDLRRPEVESLLAPARALEDHTLAWQHMSDGLGMFLRPDGWHRRFRIPAPTPELATVGDRFVMGPLLRLLSGDGHFLLLALSQRRIRLMEGSRHTVEEVELADAPTSLREVIEPQEPRSNTMARPAATAGRGGPAVFYGYGASDDHSKRDELRRYLREVSRGLQGVLAAQTSPMVLIGLDQLVATFREVNSYPHALGEAVIHNPDELPAEELHRLAWPLVERRLREERAGAIGRFHSQRSTGRASGDLVTVARAAGEGRVETLFVQADPWCWERAGAGSPPVFRVGAGGDFGDCGHVDATAVATLDSGGQVYATSETVVPGSDVAAIFRY